MNRLEIAVQAPPMPDFFWDNWIEKNRLPKEEFIKSPLYDKSIKSYYDYKDDFHFINKKNYSIYRHRAEIEWRFYWADEMIKRNDTNDRL